MAIHPLLSDTATAHRANTLPSGNYHFYQEWNNAIFLHWRVDPYDLKKWIPRHLEIDFHNEEAWVSFVAFSMKNTRMRNGVSFKPISDFDEINLRTYVIHRGKPGVYFLSIEASKRLSCIIARSISGLPYRYSAMNYDENKFHSHNRRYGDSFKVDYNIGQPLKDKNSLDKWLTERYAVFHYHENDIYEYQVHHREWSLNKIEIQSHELKYAHFGNLIRKVELAHYSSGVKVLAWGRKTHTYSS